MRILSIVEYCVAVLQAFNFPANVSYSFGGPGNPRYFVNQIHYDNPNEVTGKLILSTHRMNSMMLTSYIWLYKRPFNSNIQCQLYNAKIRNTNHHDWLPYCQRAIGHIGHVNVE